jgi:hypothetical protein
MNQVGRALQTYVVVSVIKASDVSLYESQSSTAVHSDNWCPESRQLLPRTTCSYLTTGTNWCPASRQLVPRTDKDFCSFSFEAFDEIPKEYAKGLSGPMGAFVRIFLGIFLGN